MKRLLLIDGNAMLHRAYHAIPPLTAPDGSVVNAVYGFGTTLVRLIGDLKPTHVAVAFDMPKPTFRKKLFKGYQSKRPKLDADLADQIPKVHALIESFGIPIFEKDGFEADDVIGTLAQKNTGQVIIVTGDRDIFQLVVDDKVFVYMPVKGLSEAKLYDEKAVVERMGVLPSQIPDYKALAGDASDNYPGVEGIGPKTATDLLKKYKTLSGVYAHLSQVKETVAARLRAGKESATLGLDLATIRRNVPLSGSLKPIEDLNRPEAVRELTKLGFRTLLKRVTGEEIKRDIVGVQSPAPEVKKEKVHTQQELF